MSDVPVEQLDARVKLSVQRLDELASLLLTVPTAKSEAWLEKIEQIRQNVKPVRVVIGVVYASCPPLFPSLLLCLG